MTDWMRSVALLGGLFLMLAPNVAAAGDGSDTARMLAILTSGALLGGAVAMCVPVFGKARVATFFTAAGLCSYGFLWTLFIATGTPELTRRGAVSHVPFSPTLLAIGVTLLALGLRLDDDDAHRPAAFAAFVIAAFGFVPLSRGFAPGSMLTWLPDTLPIWIVGSAVLLGCALLCAFVADTPLGAFPRAAARGVLALRSRWFVLIASALAFTLALVVAVWSFSLRPRSADEFAQLWQAKILLSGRLALPVDANSEFFAIDNVVDRGAWYSQFPMGGAILLALGAAVRAAWLVNPLLLALAVIHLYRFARVAYGESFARWSTLLFVLAPLVLLMSGTYMNHVPALWLTTLALDAYAHWSTSDERRLIRRAAAILGLAVAGLASIRPYDALVLAAVIGVSQLRLITTNAERRRSLLVQLLAGLPLVLFVFWTNWRTTGNPLRFGYDAMYGAGHSPGFHIDPYGLAFTPLRGFVYATSYLFQLNLLLFEWAMPALAIVVCALVLVRRGDAGVRWDMLLVSFFLAQLVAYGLYWHYGEFLGPRFLFSALPAVVLLAARAPALASTRWRGRARAAAIAFLPLATLGAWLPLPISTGAIARMRYYRDQQRRYEPDPFALIAGDTATRALVFVDVGITQRTARRLWALGVPRATATNFISQGNACSLIPAIDAEEATPENVAGRIARLQRAADHLTTDRAEMAVCDARMTSQRGAGLDYGTFLLHNEIGADGRLAGRVIYAADLSERNERLRQRFSDRTWYRLTARVNGRVTQPVLLPYAR